MADTVACASWGFCLLKYQMRAFAFVVLNPYPMAMRYGFMFIVYLFMAPRSRRRRRLEERRLRSTGLRAPRVYAVSRRSAMRAYPAGATSRVLVCDLLVTCCTRTRDGIRHGH
eukprot:363788-Prymnesium_polylepis.4